MNMRRRDERIYDMWRAQRKNYDYRTGYGPSPLLAVARQFRMPIIQVRGIVAEQRQLMAERHLRGRSQC